MSELIVLGLIPGTQIQITFVLWIMVIAAIVVTVTVKALRRRHVLRNWVISISMLMLTRQTIGRP